jgi:uncharacterized protein (DUF433 family)
MSKEKCPTGEETRLTPAEETALRDERDRARAIAQQIEELQSRPPKVTETPLTFTDAEGAPFAIDYEDGGYDEFTYGQIAKACAERGYAVVSVLGTEPTDEELNRTALGSPGEARRALFRAGSLSRQPEIDELRASERAAQERVKELEKRQAATFGQLSDAQYSKGRILEARIEWEKRATAAVERAATAERRLSALDDTRAVLGMRLEEPDSAAAEKACALHERLETAEDELARVRAELDRVTTSLGGADEHKTKFEAIRERDEARTKLAELEQWWQRRAARDATQIVQLRSQLNQQRAVVEAAKHWQSFDETIEGEHVSEFSAAETALSRAVKALASAGSSSPQDSAPAPKSEPAPTHCGHLVCSARNRDCREPPLRAEPTPKPEAPKCEHQPVGGNDGTWCFKCYEDLTVRPNAEPAPKPEAAFTATDALAAVSKALKPGARILGVGSPCPRQGGFTEPPWVPKPEPAEVGTSGDDEHAHHLPWHVLNGPRVYDSFGGLVATFSTLADAELTVAACNATQRIDRVDGASVTIVCRSGRCGGDPTIGVSRLQLSVVVEAIRAGHDDDFIRANWPSVRDLSTLTALRRIAEATSAEPVAQGVSRERVERLRDKLHMLSMGSIGRVGRAAYRNAAEMLSELLAASPEGEQGGGR